jgi:hypothetical protein
MILFILVSQTGVGKNEIAAELSRPKTARQYSQFAGKVNRLIQPLRRSKKQARVN